MAIQIPSEFKSFMEVLSGMKMPDGNEDKMFALAGVHRDLEKRLNDLPQMLNDCVSYTAGSFSGPAAQQYREAMAPFLNSTGIDYIKSMSGQAAMIAEFTSDTATQIQYAKYMIIAQCIELMLELAIALALAFFTGGASILEYLASRAVVEFFMKNMLARILGQILLHEVISIGMGAAMDSMVQWIQLLQGTRDHFDTKSLIEAVKFGAIQGLITLPMGAVGGLLGKGLGNLFGKNISREISNTVGNTLGNKAFGKELGDILGPALTRGNGPLSEAAANALTRNVGKAFADRLGTAGEREIARAAGEKWARELLGNFGKSTLPAALRTSLAGLEGVIGKDLMKALSKGVPDTLARDLARSFGNHLGQGLTEGVTQVLAEGTYNLIFGENHTFESSALTFGSGVVGGRLGHLAETAGSHIGVGLHEKVFGGSPQAAGIGTPPTGLTAGSGNGGTAAAATTGGDTTTTQAPTTTGDSTTGTGTDETLPVLPLSEVTDSDWEEYWGAPDAHSGADDSTMDKGDGESSPPVPVMAAPIAVPTASGPASSTTPTTPTTATPGNAGRTVSGQQEKPGGTPVAAETPGSTGTGTGSGTSEGGESSPTPITTTDSSPDLNPDVTPDGTPDGNPDGTPDSPRVQPDTESGELQYLAVGDDHHTAPPETEAPVSVATTSANDPTRPPTTPPTEPPAAVQPPPTRMLGALPGTQTAHVPDVTTPQDHSQTPVVTATPDVAVVQPPVQPPVQAPPLLRIAGRYYVPTEGPRAGEYTWQSYEDSATVKLLGPNGAEGLTPDKVTDWFAEHGIALPPGGIRDALDHFLYDTARDAPVVYTPDQARQFRTELAAQSSAKHAEAQERVLEAVSGLARRITETYPPEEHVYIGLGRSPGAVIAALQVHATTETQAHSIPLSAFRPGPESPGSIQYQAFLQGPQRIPLAPLTLEQRDMLFAHFDEFVPEIPLGKSVVLIDYTQGGLSLFAAERLLGEYFVDKDRTDVVVNSLALHQDINTDSIHRTYAGIGKPRGMFQDPGDWFANTSAREEWARRVELLSLRADGELGPDGKVLGESFKHEAFDGLSEFGSYKLLEVDPATFDAERPRRVDGEQATGYHQTLKRQLGENQDAPAPIHTTSEEPTAPTALHSPDQVGATHPDSPHPAPDFGDRQVVFKGSVQEQIRQVTERYPWLPDVNPHRDTIEEARTNCLLTAIATDMSLAENVGHQAPPAELSPADHLANYRQDRPPLAVHSYEDVVAAMHQAGPGARGMVVIGTAGDPVAHVLNVVHDENGIVFLDGQTGLLADLPHAPDRLEFFPTHGDFSEPTTPHHEGVPDGGSGPLGAIVSKNRWPAEVPSEKQWKSSSSVALASRPDALTALDHAVTAFHAAPSATPSERRSRLDALQTAVESWEDKHRTFTGEEITEKRVGAVRDLRGSVDAARVRLALDLRGPQAGDPLPFVEYRRVAVYSAGAMTERDGTFLGESRTDYEAARQELPGSAREADIRVRMLETRIREAHADFVRKQEAHPPGEDLLGLFTAPEWFFKRPEIPFTLGEKEMIITSMLNLSAELPGLLIVPGSTVWSEPGTPGSVATDGQVFRGDTTFKAGTSAVLNGRLVHETTKKSEGMDVTGYTPDRDTRRTMGPDRAAVAQKRGEDFAHDFNRAGSGVTDTAAFTVGNRTITVEICLDHAKNRAFDELSAAPKADLQIVVSHGAALTRSALRAGGIAVHNDASDHSGNTAGAVRSVHRVDDEAMVHFPRPPGNARPATEVREFHTYADVRNLDMGIHDLPGAAQHLLGAVSGGHHVPTVGAEPDLGTQRVVHGGSSDQLTRAGLVERHYPWLPGVNPFRDTIEQARTNCLLTAIATDLSLSEGVGHQAPPSELSPAHDLANYRDRPPVTVTSYAEVVAAMHQAGPGARGMVVVGTAGDPVAHVFNVVHDENGVVLLDGQTGRLADLPPAPDRLEFLPTHGDFPERDPSPHHVADAGGDEGREGPLGATDRDNPSVSTPPRMPSTAEWKASSEVSGSLRSRRLRDIDAALDAYHAPSGSERTITPQDRLSRLGTVQKAIEAWESTKRDFTGAAVVSDRSGAVAGLRGSVDEVRRNLTLELRSSLAPDPGPARRFERIAVYGAGAMTDRNGAFLRESEAAHDRVMTRLPSTATEVDIRIEMLSDRVREAHRDFLVRQRSEADPDALLGLFTAPEWYFKRPKIPFTLGEKEMIITSMVALSREHPDLLIIPGSTVWAEPHPSGNGIVIKAGSSAVLNGRLVHETTKMREGLDVDGYTPGREDRADWKEDRKRQAQALANDLYNGFNAAGSQVTDRATFTVGNRTIALEICQDHNNRRAVNERTPADVQILVAHGSDLRNSALRDGGIGVFNDATDHSTIIEDPKPVGAMRQVKVADGAGRPNASRLLTNRTRFIEYGDVDSLYMGVYDLPANPDPVPGAVAEPVPDTVSSDGLLGSVWNMSTLSSELPTETGGPGSTTVSTRPGSLADETFLAIIGGQDTAAPEHPQGTKRLRDADPDAHTDPSQETPPAKRPYTDAPQGDRGLIDRGLVPPTPEQHRALNDHVASLNLADGQLPHVTSELLRFVAPTEDRANCLEANLSLWDTLDGRPRAAGTLPGSSPERLAVWSLSKLQGPAWHFGEGPQGMEQVRTLVRDGGPGTRALVLVAGNGEVGHAVTVLHTADGRIQLIDPQQRTVHDITQGDTTPPLPDDSSRHSVWAHVRDGDGMLLRGEGQYDESLYHDHAEGTSGRDFGMLPGGEGEGLQRLFPRRPAVELPGWKAAAESFETRVAKHAYRLSRGAGPALDTNSPVTKALARLKNGLDEFFGTASAAVSLRPFLKNDRGSAGQIQRTGLADGHVVEMLTGGNPREKFTAFYNAAYYASNAGTPAEDRGFKKALIELMRTEDWAAAGRMGLDVDALKSYRAQLYGPRRENLHGFLERALPGQAYMFANDPFALGNLILSKDGATSSLVEMVLSQIYRTARPVDDHEFGSGKLTPAQLERHKAELSARELRFLQDHQELVRILGVDLAAAELATVPRLPNGLPDIEQIMRDTPGAVNVRYRASVELPGAFESHFTLHEVTVLVEARMRPREGDLPPFINGLPVSGPELPLRSIGGEAYYTLAESRWTRDMEQRGIPVIAGLSGTTTRMLSAFQWLNVSGATQAEFLVGLIGWMRLHNDHSLYEILRGAQMAGFEGEGGRKFDLTDAASMYRSLSALGPAFDMRTFREIPVADRLGPDNPDPIPWRYGLLPHELLYRDAAHSPEGFLALERDPLDPQADDPLELATDLTRELFEESVTPGSSGNTELADWFTAHHLDAADLVVTFNKAHIIALLAYTGSNHTLINLAIERQLGADSRVPLLDSISVAARLKLRGFVAKELAGTDPELPSMFFHDRAVAENIRDFHAAPATDLVTRGRLEAELYARVDELLPRIVKEAKLHADMAVEALRILPGATAGPLWRGDWAAGADTTSLGVLGSLMFTYSGDTVTTSSIASSSTDHDVALGFATDNPLLPMTHRVLLEITPNGANGRDIHPFSAIDGEGEVTFLPGARLRITGREWRTRYVPGPNGALEPRKYELITLTEV
ncbi:toxin glutamine deamidase domain-containing protein [Streptomyces sp. H39-C1]|uniref:toxin glutamine deamidase domain-containing protein n=1 Tax=Streptomyces sp. H39-C1 TaxID=3004355 RepID=UPI0022AFD980|nr:toxin glutamine deamidase domain-containing protein [Streptomyces sp. H39-C1]MCZ4101416.1 toxin glutamine deamidase domain-containing protein [Streptomyces sp. H39-C1]